MGFEKKKKKLNQDSFEDQVEKGLTQAKTISQKQFGFYIESHQGPYASQLIIIKEKNNIWF